jgi:hypothetical protein
MSTAALDPPGNGIARALIGLLLLLGVGMIVFLHVDLPLRSAILLVYIIPFALVVCAGLALQMHRAGSAPVPAPAVWMAAVFVAGGVGFDILATLLHSPDLSLEANQVARLLLDSGHDLSFVYVYAGVCQSLIVLITLALWSALLRHRGTLVASIGEPTSFWRFLKAATGGAELTWRQWVLPLTWADLPRAYHVLWVLTVLLVAAAAERWYLGLQWFGILEGLRTVVVASALLLGLIAYFWWLARAVLRRAGRM